MRPFHHSGNPPQAQQSCEDVETQPIGVVAAWPLPAEIAAERAMAGIEIPAGTRLGTYITGERIGAGGCGAVYRASHVDLGTPAAVKVLHRDLVHSAEMVERFLREMRAANLIRHPNIIDIWDSGEVGHRPYFVMELLEGMSLRDLLRRGTFSPAEALEVLEPVCAAVEAAHGFGIIHRDLKASNIMVCDDGGGRLIKLLDFGIAKLTQSDGESTQLTAVGRKLGTPTSMSPEQVLGRCVDRRTDIYALGVLLFQMLTGRYPFESREETEIERMHLGQAPPRPSEYVAVSASVDAIVLRCLEKQPERRFESVTAFTLALRRAVEDSGRRSTSGQTTPSEIAAAMLIEVTLSEQAEETMEDATVDDVMQVLEHAKDMLIGAGLRVPLETGSAVLGVIPLPIQPEHQRAERARLVAQAMGFYQRLDQRVGKQPGVGVTVRTYLAEAVLQPTGQAEQDIAGPILSITPMEPEPAGGGLYASSDMIEGLEIAAERLSGSQLKITL